MLSKISLEIKIISVFRFRRFVGNFVYSFNPWWKLHTFIQWRLVVKILGIHNNLIKTLEFFYLRLYWDLYIVIANPHYFGDKPPLLSFNIFLRKLYF